MSETQEKAQQLLIATILIVKELIKHYLDNCVVVLQYLLHPNVFILILTKQFRLNLVVKTFVLQILTVLKKN